MIVWWSRDICDKSVESGQSAVSQSADRITRTATISDPHPTSLVLAPVLSLNQCCKGELELVIHWTAFSVSRSRSRKSQPRTTPCCPQTHTLSDSAHHKLPRLRSRLASWPPTPLSTEEVQKSKIRVQLGSCTQALIHISTGQMSTTLQEPRHLDTGMQTELIPLPTHLLLLKRCLLSHRNLQRHCQAHLRWPPAAPMHHQ